jgi:hypothetical protein
MKTNQAWLTGLVLTSLLQANSVWAQPGNLEKAVHLLEQQSRTGKGEFVTYLTGAAAAYRWANTTSSVDGRRRIYCPPPDLALDGRSYGRIAIDEYKRAKSEYAKLPQYPLDVLSLALLRGLGQRFPCKSEGDIRVTHPLTAVPATNTGAVEAAANGSVENQ